MASATASRAPGRALWLLAVAATASALVGLGSRPVVAQKDPSITLKPTSGESGDVVEVTGDSFGDAKVVIRFAGDTVATGMVVAGSFQLLFTVPQADAAAYKVTACAYNEVECDAGQATAQFEVVSIVPTPTNEATPTPVPTPTGVVVPPSIVVPPDLPLPLVPWLATAAGPCAAVPFTVGVTYSFEDTSMNRSWRVEGQRGEPASGARSGTFGLGSTYDDFGSVNRPLIVDLGTDMRREVAVFVGRDAPLEGSGPLTAVLTGYGIDQSGKMLTLARATRELEEAAIATTRCMYITAPPNLSFRAITLEYVTADGQSSAERRWIDDLTVGTGRGGYTGGNQTTASFTTPADSSTVMRATTDPLRVEIAIRSLSTAAPSANLRINGLAGPRLGIRRVPGGDPFTYIGEATITSGLVADEENRLEADILGTSSRPEFTASTRFRMAPPIAGNLRVLGMEVNQAVQVPGNRVPLIAGKPTLVRVFVEGTPDTRGAWGAITGQLTTTAGDGTRRVHNPLSDTTPHAAPISRYTSDSQLMFMLDRTETASGRLRLEVAVQPVASRPQTNLTDDRLATEVSFVAPVDYRPYGVLFSFPTGETNSWSKLEDFTRYVEAVYPVTTARMLTVPGIGRTPITVETIWWLRNWTGSLLHRLPDGATIFGLWPGTGIPRFECPSPEPSPGASPTPVPTHCLAGLAWFSRTDGYGDPYGGPLVMAQELAHGEGLWWHAESPYEPAGGIGALLNPAWPWEHASIGHVGVDLRDPTMPLILAPYRSFGDHTHDFMSYGRGGNGARWVSPFTYCELLGRLNDGRTLCPDDVQSAPMTREFIGSEPTPRAGGSATLAHAVVPEPAAAALDHEVEYLSIRGEVAWDAASATLQPIDSVYRALDLPTRETGDAFVLEISDGDGKALRSVPFTPAETHGREGEPVPFDLLVARPEGAARVSVKRGDAVLAQVDASANPPVISLDASAAEAVLRDGGVLSWTASDPDADELTYVVEASTDGRQTWWPLAVGLTSASWSIDPSTLPGSTDVWLRVQASDGFHSTATSVGPFAVARHAPTVRLADLTDGLTVEHARPLMLRAVADDAEDVELADGAVLWSSDRDGQLGSGEWIVTERLSVGRHRITATVTDSDGQTASASVTVDVPAAGAPVIASPSATANPATPTANTDLPRPTGGAGTPPSSGQADTVPVLALLGAAAAGMLIAGAVLYRRRRS